VWVAKNWGNPLKYQELAENIEMLNLDAADMVVVVSRPLKDELVDRGVEPDKILVNPNGIDPDKYSPNISGAEVCKHYGFENKLIVGFIGTFGPWHGAEILAQAAVRLYDEIDTHNLHFLFIGDGGRRLATETIIKEGNASAYCTFTGLVPQEEGAKHLAACDILISPHVPNPDGSPFFGSPTKLFEYMGMGKAIIASDLEQIGEILEHNRTALMVEPGNVDQLVKEILRLEKDKDLRNKLGKNARDAVVSKYTWNNNVENMIDALIQLKHNQNQS
jgi:glycosyltransferase involved in cell wall biosynthesis